MSDVKDIILMATADWDYPFWTNKQHTAKALLALGYRVLYIDSLGTRPVRLNQANDLKRIWHRIQKFLAKPKAVTENLWVLSPCVLPLLNSKIIRWLNQKLFMWILKFWLKKLGFHPRPIFWTYHPLTMLYITPQIYSRLIYHCVDNIAAQPNAFKDLIQQQEKILLQQAHIVFVTSLALQATIQKQHVNTHYFPNVVDFAHFNQACDDVSLPEDLKSIPQPRAGFIGAISAYKMDLTLLSRVAKANPDISFVLIGEVGIGDPLTNVDNLKTLKNVYFLGAKAYQLLPHYLKGLDVCLIPAMINDYTEAMFPMKFFEYLAAGKAVVATQLPALLDYKNMYYGANNSDEFTQQIRLALAENNLNLIAARCALAQEHTYLKRTQKMLAIYEKSL